MAPLEELELDVSPEEPLDVPPPVELASLPFLSSPPMSPGTDGAVGPSGSAGGNGCGFKSHAAIQATNAGKPR
jgi:hypothetical protein